MTIHSCMGCKNAMIVRTPLYTVTGGWPGFMPEPVRIEIKCKTLEKYGRFKNAVTPSNQRKKS